MEFTPDFVGEVSQPSIPDINLRAQALTEGAFQDPVKTASQVPPIERPLSSYLDDVVSKMASQNKAMVEYNMVESLRAASKTDPDVAGQRQRIAERLGVNVGSITGDLDIAKEMDAERQIRRAELARQFPVISSQLADINFANIAHDDIENLYKSEKSFQGLRKSFERGELANDIGYLGARMLRSKLSGEESSPEDLRRADWMRYRLNKLGESSGVWENVTEFFGQMSATIPNVVAAGYLGGKVALVAGPEAAPIGAAIGAGVAAFSQSAVIEGGNAYLDMIQMGLDPDAAASAAIGVGLVNGALELVGEELTFGLASGARRMLSKKITQEVAKAMVQRTGAQAVGKFAKQYVIGGTSEVLTEVIQEVVNIKAEQYAASRTMGPTLPQEDIADRLAAIAKKTALAMVVLGGVGPGGRLMLDAHEARAGMKRAQHFQDIQQAATDSKVKDRNPIAYRQAMQAVADGNDVSVLHAEGEAVEGVLRSLKITTEQFAQQYPELADQIPKIQNGGTVEIPSSVYQEKIARSELGKQLVRHLKIDPESYSMAESEEIIANLPAMGEEAERISEEQDKIDTAFSESAKQLETTFYESLIATGQVSKDSAKTIAKLYRDFAIVQAANDQMLPSQWHAESGVRFAGSPEVVVQAATTPDQPVSVAPDVSATPDTPAPISEPTAPVEQAKPLASRKAVKVMATYAPSTRVIDLGKDAQPENIVHELAHFFLETLMDAAFLNISGTEAGAQVALDRMSANADADALLRFFGIQGADAAERISNWQDLSFDQRAKSHELFAYSLEQYMWTGKPPTEELRSVFQSVMHWFRRAYATILDIGNAYKAETSLLNLDAKLRAGEITSEQHALDLEEIKGGKFDKYGESLPALSYEVRQVFDRLFASEQDIRRAKQVRGYVAAFQTKDEFLAAGNSEQDWDEYKQIVADADFEAYDAMMQKSLANVRWLSRAKAKEIRERADKAKELRNRIQSEVEEKMRARPVQRLRHWLKTGQVLGSDGVTVEGDGERDPVHSLNLDIVQDIVPNGTNTQDIHKHMKPNGLDPKLIYSIFDFNNATEMVLALINEPHFKDAVVAETDRRMLEEHADYVTGTKEHAAAIDSAIHNEARARMVAAQLSYVSKGKKPWRVMLGAAKIAAREQLEKMSISEISARRHSIAEAKASRQVQKALKEGKDIIAIEWARKELLQNQLASQAHDIKDEVQQAFKLFDKFGRSDEKLAKSRDMSIIMAGRAVLSAFGIGDVYWPLEHLEKLKQYNRDVYDSIIPVIAQMSQSVAPGVIGDKPVDYRKDITLGQFRLLQDNMEALWQQSLRSRQIEVAGKKESLDAVVNELNARLDKIGMPKIVRKSADEQAKLWRSIMSARASLRRVESWADAMGPEFTRYIWGRINEATDRYTADNRKFLDRYVEAMRSLKITQENIVSSRDELNWTFNSKAEVIGLLLHSGNLSNLRKLLLGRFANDNITDVDARFNDALFRYRAFLDRMFQEGVLTKEDVQFVQSVHALTADMLPLLQEAHWNRYGRHFKTVDMHEFHTPYGVIKGYVPATTDKYLVRQSANDVTLEEQADEFLKRIPSVPSSMVKERVENYWKELSLDIRMIGKHINDSLLFVHMGSAVNDVMKILGDERFSSKMNAFDPTVINDMLIPWLQTVSRQSGSKRGRWSAVDMVWNAFRKRSAMNALFGNVSNALQQATGLFPAMLKVRPGLLFDGLLKATFHGKDTAKFIKSKSEFMRNLMDNKIRLLRRDAEYILTNPSKLQRLGEWSEAHTVYLLNTIQNPVSMATWIGAYNQSLEESKSSASDAEADAEAVEAANAAVRLTQGSSAPQDIASAQTGTPFHQAVMQFTGYFNMLANLNVTEFQKILREAGWQNNKGKVLSRGFAIYMLGFALPGLISDAIARTMAGQWGKDDEDDDWVVFADWFFGSQFRSMASMIPVLGPAVAAGVRYGIGGRPMDAHMPLAPTFRTIDSLYGAVGATRKAIVGESELTGRNLRDWATALSMILDVPLDVVSSPLGYAMDVERGNIHPQEYLGMPESIDYVRGLITGSASDGSKKGR